MCQVKTCQSIIKIREQEPIKLEHKQGLLLLPLPEDLIYDSYDPCVELFLGFQSGVNPETVPLTSVKVLYEPVGWFSETPTLLIDVSNSLSLLFLILFNNTKLKPSRIIQRSTASSVKKTPLTRAIKLSNAQAMDNCELLRFIHPHPSCTLDS